MVTLNILRHIIVTLEDIVYDLPPGTHSVSESVASFWLVSAYSTIAQITETTPVPPVVNTMSNLNESTQPLSDQTAGSQPTPLT